MIRTLIVDDSATARLLLKELLGRDPEMVVVAEADSGEMALEMADRLRPDLITMDVQLPCMNGFETSSRIMESRPTPIVIVTGSTNVGEVDTAMEALRVGALAAIKKPSPGSPRFETEARRMIATLKAMAEVRLLGRPSAARRRVRPERSSMPLSPAPLRTSEAPAVVAIGSSTGGPQAVDKLLSSLPTDFAVPILLVQHISPGFTRGYARWLNSRLALPVKLAAHGEPLLGGTVYVAQDDRHLGVTVDGRVKLMDTPPVNGFKPSCSVLYSSAAAAFGSSVIAIILTGMGVDGVSGLHDVRAAGGRIFAQDEASSVVFGMPKSAIEQGLASRGTSLERIAAELNRLVPKPA